MVIVPQKVKKTQLIGVEGTETPAEGEGHGRDPTGAYAPRRLPDRLRISAVPGTEINGLYDMDTQKTVDNLNCLGFVYRLNPTLLRGRVFCVFSIIIREFFEDLLPLSYFVVTLVLRQKMSQIDDLF